MSVSRSTISLWLAIKDVHAEPIICCSERRVLLLVLMRFEHVQGSRSKTNSNWRRRRDDVDYRRRGRLDPIFARDETSFHRELSQGRPGKRSWPQKWRFSSLDGIYWSAMSFTSLTDLIARTCNNTTLYFCHFLKFSSRYEAT